VEHLGSDDFDPMSPQRRTVPGGGGFGRVFKVDGLQVDAGFGAFGNVERPTRAAATPAQAPLH
jgi:hypothetical protein